MRRSPPMASYRNKALAARVTSIDTVSLVYLTTARHGATNARSSPALPTTIEARADAVLRGDTPDSV